jgi:VWFA-related protein
MSRSPRCTLFALTLATASLPLLAQETPPAQQPAPPQPAQTAPELASPATVGSQNAGAQPKQNPDGTYTLKVSTRLVILDVVATDKQGNIVQGLTKENFHVTEGDDPQTITNFELGGVRLPKPELDIESTADLDRLAPRAPVNIILLDEFNTRFEDMAFAQYSLKKYLQKQPDHLNTPTMLIAVQIDKFEVLDDYTQDKQKLLDSLKHHFSGNPWRNTSNSWAAERYGTAFLTLRRVSEAVIGHQGHKNMIWIGRGFPAINMANQPLDTTSRIENLRQQCVNGLRDARVTLTTIDPAGVLIDPGVYGSAAAFNDPMGGNYQFAQLAKATGGRTIYGRNDVDVQIDAAAQEGTSFYTLVYHPTNTSFDPTKFRKIKVTVDRPGVNLSTSQGYYLSYRPRQVDAKAPGRNLITDLAAAGNSTMAYDGAQISVDRTSDPKTYIVHVAARSLGWTIVTPSEPLRHTDVVVAVSAFDKKGKIVEERAFSMKFNAPANVAPAGRIEVPLNFPFKYEASSKAQRVRFVVRIGASGRIGTADIDLTQPLPAPATPTPAAALAP